MGAGTSIRIALLRTGADPALGLLARDRKSRLLEGVNAMPVRFLRNASELADVSWETPLPVQVANAKPVPADTLLVATTTVTTDANRDLLGSTATELPTLDGCGQYRKLVWFYFRAGGADTTYRVLARATDHNGAPLGAGWQETCLRHAARRREQLGTHRNPKHRRRLLRPVPHRSSAHSGQRLLPDQ
jgi:hypothetical protein